MLGPGGCVGTSGWLHPTGQRSHTQEHKFFCETLTLNLLMYIISRSQQQYLFIKPRHIPNESFGGLLSINEWGALDTGKLVEEFNKVSL